MGGIITPMRSKSPSLFPPLSRPSFPLYFPLLSPFVFEKKDEIVTFQKKAIYRQMQEYKRLFVRADADLAEARRGQGDCLAKLRISYSWWKQVHFILLINHILVTEWGGGASLIWMRGGGFYNFVGRRWLVKRS